MPQKLPVRVLAYWLVKDALIVLAVYLLLNWLVPGSDLTVNGEVVSTNAANVLPIIAAVALVCYLVLAAYRSLYFALFTFSVENTLVSTNKGVIVRSHKSVQYEEAENAEVTRGPLQMLFGLGNLRVYTASPAQLLIVQSKNGSRTIHRPDVNLILMREDAMALREHFNVAVNRVAVVAPK